MNKEPISDFVQAARKGSNHWSLYLATIGIIIVMILLGNIPLLIPILLNPELLNIVQGGAFSTDELGLPPAIGLIFMIAPFAFGLLGLVFSLSKIHKRAPITLVTPNSHINWKKILFAAGLWFVFSIVLEGINYLVNPEIYTWTFEASRFFPVLIAALLFLPLQTTFEELFFRGYLLQGFSLSTRRKWMAILLSSTIFGLMHIMNPEVTEFGMVTMAYYMGMGVFLSLMTLMDESAEIAIGLHAGNNIFGAVIISFPESVLQFPTLFRAEEIDFIWSMIGWAVAAVIFYFIMARIYQWKDYEKLFEKVSISDPRLDEIGIE